MARDFRDTGERDFRGKNETRAAPPFCRLFFPPLLDSAGSPTVLDLFTLPAAAFSRAPRSLFPGAEEN